MINSEPPVNETWPIVSFVSTGSVPKICIVALFKPTTPLSAMRPWAFCTMPASLFKNSSLAMAIGASELTQVVKEIESQTFRTFESYLIATVLYLAISLVIMAVGAWTDRRAALATAR